MRMTYEDLLNRGLIKRFDFGNPVGGATGGVINYRARTGCFYWM